MVRSVVEIVSLAAIAAGFGILLGVGAGLVAVGVAGLVVSWRTS